MNSNIDINTICQLLCEQFIIVERRHIINNNLLALSAVRNSKLQIFFIIIILLFFQRYFSGSFSSWDKRNYIPRSIYLIEKSQKYFPHHHHQHHHHRHYHLSHQKVMKSCWMKNKQTLMAFAIYFHSQPFGWLL